MMMRLLILLLLLVVVVLSWSGVTICQSTTNVNCDSGSDVSSSAFQSMAKLARYQAHAAKNIDNAARDLTSIRQYLQHLHKLPTSTTNSSCTLAYLVDYLSGQTEIYVPVRDIFYNIYKTRYSVSLKT